MWLNTGVPSQQCVFEHLFAYNRLIHMTMSRHNCYSDVDFDFSTLLQLLVWWHCGYCSAMLESINHQFTGHHDIQQQEDKIQ
jgi:hypothetical protein